MRTITTAQAVETLTLVVGEAMKEYGPDVDYDVVANAAGWDEADGRASNDCQYRMQDFTYTTTDRQPGTGCLVGRVLDRLDIPYNLNWEGNRFGVLPEEEGEVARLDATVDHQIPGVVFERGAMLALARAQRSQDNRLPWREALDLALVEAANAVSEP